MICGLPSRPTGPGGSCARARKRLGEPLGRDAGAALLQRWGLRSCVRPCALNNRHSRPFGQQQPGGLSPPFEQLHSRERGPHTPPQQQQRPGAWPWPAASAAPHAGGGAGAPFSGPVASAAANSSSGAGGSGSYSYAPLTSSPYSSGSSPGGSLDDLGQNAAGTAALRGASPAGPPSAKHLLAQQLHSVENMEPLLGSLEDYSGFDTLEDGRADGSGGAGTGPMHHGKQASVATFEVLRVDASGQVRRVHVRRRDLLREHMLQPRDLRRVDPSVDVAKTAPSIAVKESALLVNLGGVRAIVTAEKALFFEPSGVQTRRLLDLVIPRLQASAAARLAARTKGGAAAGASEADTYMREANRSGDGSAATPFELEVLEGVLMVSTGRLERHMTTMSQRVHALMTKLPNDINPINLEELRRIKQDLVQLENKADQLRELLEEIMDDEDELREINLSSRPRREERRKQRERDRANRQLSRAKEEMEERRREGEKGSGGSESGSSGGAGGGGGGSPERLGGNGARRGGGGDGYGGGMVTTTQAFVVDNGGGVVGMFRQQQQQHLRGRGGRPLTREEAEAQRQNLAQAARRARMAELYSKFGDQRPGGGAPASDGWSSGSSSSRQREQDDLDPEDEYQDAQDALDELADQEEEEAELEEVEDLLEYYLQRVSATQSEAERQLEGARDLEESIGVSLSARRYEVNRLELMLSMGSFAAALGAMFAGIFGMNMKSTLEFSVFGFWGITAAIVLGCTYVFVAIMKYTQRRKIL